MMGLGHDATVNDVGGIFAGSVALLACLGGGIRWLLNWRIRRQDGRAAKLQVWHDELKAREQRLDAERENEIHDIKASLERMSGEHRALFQAYHLIANALSRLDPVNPALSLASQLLSAAFKLDSEIPRDMAGLLRQVREGPKHDHL